MELEQLYNELEAIHEEYGRGRMSFDEYIELTNQITGEIEELRN
jgi:hypothetical protein